MNEEFERQKLCFEQNAQSVRSLNAIMWQVPLIAMTLTGGLWYGVATSSQLPTIAQYALLLFTAIADLLLVPIIWRIRSVMQAYIDKTVEFYPAGAPDTRTKLKAPNEWLSNRLNDKIVVKIFSILLLVAAILSILGAIFLPRNSSEAPSACLEIESLKRSTDGGELHGYKI